MSLKRTREDDPNQPSSPIEDIKKADLGLDSLEKRIRDNLQFFYEVSKIELNDQIVNELITFYLQEILDFWERVLSESDMNTQEKMLMQNMDGGFSLDFILNFQKDLGLMNEIRVLQAELVICREELAEMILDAFKPVSEEENVVVATIEVDGKMVDVKLNDGLEHVRNRLADDARNGLLNSHNFESKAREASINFFLAQGEKNEAAIYHGENFFKNHAQPRIKSEPIINNLKKSDELSNLIIQLNNKLSHPANLNSNSNEKIALSNPINRSKIGSIKLFEEKYMNQPKENKEINKLLNENNANADNPPAKRARF